MCYFAYEDVRVRAGSPCEPTAQMDLSTLIYVSENRSAGPAWSSLTHSSGCF